MAQGKVSTPCRRRRLCQAWGPTMSIYAMSLTISLFITILMIYSGFQGIESNKIKAISTKPPACS
jgi:hypothetical protein